MHVKTGVIKKIDCPLLNLNVSKSFNTCEILSTINMHTGNGSAYRSPVKSLIITFLSFIVLWKSSG